MTSDHVVNMCSYPDGQSCTRELVLIAHQTVCNKMNPTNHTNTCIQIEECKIFIESWQSDFNPLGMFKKKWKIYNPL